MTPARGRGRRHWPWLALALLWASPGQAATLAEVMDDYVAEALSSNLALQGQDAQLQSAQAVLEQARAQYWPTLGVAARYTLAQGGRTLNFPVGDLLNPAYATLNEMLVAAGQSPRFPLLANQEIPLLRPREQDTHLELRQPLYAPAIAAGKRVSESLLQSVEQQRLAVRQALKRDVRVAYLSWLQARDAAAIVSATATVLEENLRINQALFRSGKLTQDQPLRAEAELLAVQQQQLSADQQVQQAQRWLNLLRNQPLASPLRVAAVETLPATPASAPVPEVGQRAELKQLDAATRAASAQVTLAAAAAQPTLGLGVDAGIQGSGYGLGPDYRYVSGSLLLNWKFYAGGGFKAAVSAARADERRLQLQRAELAAQLQLQLAQADDRYRTAQRALDTAAARLAAAQAAWRIAERKRDAGAINQVEYLDARSAATQAELALNVARYAVQVEWAQRQFAAGEE